ncbi:MAG: GreA/GreB family elongation factor [Lentisphaeria bacterium]|nr:GreA/GreB family elongation factor [Lentisphaeria bacterium]
MNTSAFEDLILNAVEHPDKAVCCELTKQLEAMESPMPAEIAEKLEILWEGWSGALSDVQASFCLTAATRGAADTPLFRKVFATAVKRLLPPYLSGAPIMRALGVRDDKKPPVEVAARLRRLLALKVGVIIFMPSTKRWAVAGTVDAISGTLPVTAFAGSGGAARMPLEVILPEAVLLNPGTELSRLVEPLAKPLPSEMLRTALMRRAVFPLDDDMMQQMAHAGCARGLDAVAFETWWKGGAAVPAAAAGGKRSCNGRSIKEMSQLLAEEAKTDAPKFTAEEAALFAAFFTKQKAETAVREEKTLAEIVGAVFPRLDPAQAKEVFGSLIGKASFWPAAPATVPLNTLAVWGDLSAKVLEPLTKASFAVLSPEVLSALVMKLPLKALNFFVPCLGDGVLLDTVCRYRNCGADIMMWVWKNRKKLPDAELIDLINIENVTRTLASEEPPKEWGAARRELRLLLMDDAAFQTRLLEAAAGNVEMVCTILQSALFLSSGERQSLIVKLARLSPSLRSQLESGAGSRIIHSDKNHPEEAPEVPVDTGLYTSVKSQKAMVRELEDIINVQIPENREALVTARAHGDFRENSEFKAAKDRKRHLNRRRNELERDLAQVHPVMMSQVKVSDEAVIGCEVELKYEDGETEVYQLLGAWDGDPERKFLSYRARLGAAVLHRKVGEEFAAPGGRKCKLAAVRELAPELKAELDA